MILSASLLYAARAIQEVSTSWDIRSLLLLFPIYFVVGMLISLFLVLVPVIKLLRRTGHNPAWSVFAIFPGLNLIALWFFAFKPWPIDRNKNAPTLG
jgi:hypothetical protein